MLHTSTCEMQAFFSCPKIRTNKNMCGQKYKRRIKKIIKHQEEEEDVYFLEHY